MHRPFPSRIPWKAILIVLTFIMSLIIKGLGSDEAIRQAAKFFGIPEAVLRRILKT